MTPLRAGKPPKTSILDVIRIALPWPRNRKPAGRHNRASSASVARSNGRQSRPLPRRRRSPAIMWVLRWLSRRNLTPPSAIVTRGPMS